MLVVCGSFVPASTAQLERLEQRHPEASVAARVAALAGDGAEAEVERLAPAARARIGDGGLAVVATERERDPGSSTRRASERIAGALAQVARRVAAGVVIAKGGITSAVTARDGLGARCGARGRSDRARRRALAAVDGHRLRGRARQRRRPRAAGRRGRGHRAALPRGRAVLTPFADLLAARRDGHGGRRLHVLRPRDRRGRAARGGRGTRRA